MCGGGMGGRAGGGGRVGETETMEVLIAIAAGGPQPNCHCCLVPSLCYCLRYCLLQAGPPGLLETRKDRLVRLGVLTPFDSLEGYDRRVTSVPAPGGRGAAGQVGEERVWGGEGGGLDGYDRRVTSVPAPGGRGAAGQVGGVGEGRCPARTV